MWKLFSAVLAIIASGAAQADEATITLKDEPGRDAVMNNCAACHSGAAAKVDTP